jgi:glycosyltransferase involved in cell wall biosynthesis
MHGPVLMYYFYSHEELLAAATGSEFCIFLDVAETQGLAALEIMACGCPLFVIDCNDYRAEGFICREVTSVTCWSPQCGIKSSIASFTEDFPRFLAGLASGDYDPREFVLTDYSWCAAAKNLRRMLETIL